MLLLLKQNFVAHKRSNKLTSVIFAMSIGVVIFARVATQIVLDSSAYKDDVPLFGDQTKIGDDADVTVVMYESQEYTPRDFDPILLSNTASIKNFGMCSKRHRFQNKVGESEAATARILMSVFPSAVAPTDIALYAA